MPWELEMVIEEPEHDTDEDDRLQNPYTPAPNSKGQLQARAVPPHHTSPPESAPPRIFTHCSPEDAGAPRQANAHARADVCTRAAHVR